MIPRFCSFSLSSLMLSDGLWRVISGVKGLGTNDFQNTKWRPVADRTRDTKSFKMSLSVSKTTNSRALIGRLKRFDYGIRRVFELAAPPADSRQNLFETFAGDPLDRREIQTYPAWKVQTCFRNLNRYQRKRSKQRKIYILPIGPFPEVLWKTVEGMEVSIFELLVKFAAVFFHGMTVTLMDEILATEVYCKRRVHPDTGKLQLLVKGKLRDLH